LLGPDQEGWVVEFSDGSRWKVKGDRYLELHKLISGLTFKWTLTEMANGTIQSTKQVIPEEFLVQVDEWMAEIEAIIRQVKAQAAAAFEQAPKHSRKDFALWVQQHHQTLAPYLFAQLDRKDITPLIYKLAFRDRVTDDVLEAGVEMSRS
jgi:RNA ligase